MSVHVQRMESDVTVEPEPASGEGTAAPAMGEGMSWEELDRLRQGQRAACRDLQRTCARGFDD
jgi:hypothetical protein